MEEGFCHDDYEHPLLWCEGKRRAEEKKIVQTGLEEARRHKDEIRENKTKEVQEYRDMIKKHYPWGRPGGGAPNEHIRIGDLTTRGIYPDSRSNDCRTAVYGPPIHTARFKMGGGGAPIRSSSGRVVTTLKEDPLISYNDANRRHVDIALRYRTTRQNKMNYKMQLDQLVAEKERIAGKRRSFDKITDPWGKAGPGGMPWRPPKNIGHSFMKSMGWTDTHLLQTLDAEKSKVQVKIENDESNDKGEHSNLQKKDDPEKREREQKHLTTTEIPVEHYTTDEFYSGCCCPNCCCRCLLNSHKKYKRKKDTLSYKCKDHSISRTKEKNGCVAKDSNINRNQTHHKSKDFRPRQCMITGGVELVPLLARRRALSRPTTLSSTDVTKYQKSNSWIDGGVHYLDDLCRQINQKQRIQQINREQEVKSTIQHFDTWETFWGRPGHGAPREIKTKLNLNDLLYKTPLK